MIAALVMVGFCAAGVGFLICFFVGTCKQQACVWICQLLQLQSEPENNSLNQQESTHEQPLAAA
jgi:hypothetical protein